MQNKDPTRFYFKKEIKQGYDKKNIPKIGVEQTKSNGEFFFYLYQLDTQFKEVFKKTSNLHVTYVHPCVNYE